MMEIKFIGVRNLIVKDRGQNTTEIQKKQPQQKEVSETLQGLKEKEPQKIEMPFKTTAFFDIDKDGNVVIKIVDSEGNVIRQIPPEEYIAMVRELKKAIKNLIDIEV